MNALKFIRIYGPFTKAVRAFVLVAASLPAATFAFWAPATAMKPIAVAVFMALDKLIVKINLVFEG